MPHAADIGLSRRTFLGAVAAAPLIATAAAGAAPTPVRLGGPIFLKSDDPVALAKEHRRLGYSAAYCPAASPTDGDRVRAIREAFKAENVVIAEVGAWRNMLDPDPQKRAANLAYVTERMALAEAVAARCCVDIAGSFNPTVWYGPDPKNLSQEFFDLTVENCRKVIDAVKPKQTTFSIEMMGWNLPGRPGRVPAADQGRRSAGVRRAHGRLQRHQLAARASTRNADFIRECFAKLGRWIVSCHAKDLAFIPEMNVHFKEVVPGTGQVDYATYCARSRSCPSTRR